MYSHRPRPMILALGVALLAALGLTVAPTAQAEPPAAPPVAVMATGTVLVIAPDPGATASDAASTVIVLADGTSVPVSDAGVAATLSAGDEVSVGVLVPADVIAALSDDEAAALAAQPVVDGLVQVPVSTDLGARLLNATLAATSTPGLTALAVTSAPEVSTTAEPDVTPTAEPEETPTVTPDVTPVAEPDEAPTVTPDEAPAPAEPPVAVMAAGRVSLVAATPVAPNPDAPAADTTSVAFKRIALAGGISVPVSDPDQAAMLGAGDEVSVGVLVPADVIAALSGEDTAALAAQPVVDGVVQVPASTDLGGRLLGATVAATPTPTLTALAVTFSPETPSLAVPGETPDVAAGPVAAGVTAAALNQTIDLVIAFPGTDASPWLTDAQAKQYIADAQAWYRANTGLTTFTFTVSAVKHLTNSTGFCGNQTGTETEWIAAAALFGHTTFDDGRYRYPGYMWYEVKPEAQARHLIVFENQSACPTSGPNAITYGGLGDVPISGVVSMASGGYTMNRLLTPATAGTRQYAYNIQDIVHELGHNYGLWHSSRVVCQSKSGTATWNMADAGSCSPILDETLDYVPANTTYGDAFEFMGYGYVPNAMGATRKYQLGLLAASAVTSVPAPVTAQAVTLLAVPTGDSTTPQLVYVADSKPDTGTKDPFESSYMAGSAYTVELRHYTDPYGYAANLPITGFSAGYAFVVLRANAGSTYLYQPTGSYSTLSGYSAYTLKAGATFTSADGLISITVVSVPAASCTANCTGKLSITRKDPPTVIGGVAIAGTPQVDKVLTANATGVTPGNATLSYQWYRNGVAITGATGQTYTPTPADYQTNITVKVTAAAPQHETTSKTSAAVGPVKAGDMTAPVPTITGGVWVGQTLTVLPGGWKPADATLTYQWYADGVPISGATGKTYVVSAAVVGKMISVKVTGTRTAYVTASNTSIKVGPVFAGEPVSMYRLFNPVTGEHFYTSSLYEATVNVQRGPWKSEGVGWLAPPAGTGVPVYRLGAKPGTGSAGHLYSTNEAEIANAMATGQWNDEGIGWYSAGTVSIFRQYDPATGQHNYTADANEIWVITSQQGWVQELIVDGVVTPAWLAEAPGIPGDQTVINAAKG